MTEAALFYEMAHPNLGDDFLDDIKFAIDAVRDRPKLGVDPGYGFRRDLVRRFRSASSTLLSRDRLSWSPSRTKAAGPTIGGRAHDC